MMQTRVSNSKMSSHLQWFVVVGADTRVRVTYLAEELELRLPFGSQARLFLSEVNRAWSGKTHPLHDTLNTGLQYVLITQCYSE